MNEYQKSQFYSILSNIIANQDKSRFENLHTVVTFLLNSNSRREITTPFFRLCGSEQICHIKMEFHRSTANIILVHKFEEELYRVKPIFTLIAITKDGETEEFSPMGCNVFLSTFKYEKYFNSKGFFEIQFTIHYIPNMPTCLRLTPTKSVLYDRLLNMYMERKCTDVKLLVEDKKYSVHKSILARSPVFKAMFQHEMREKHENVVNISGIESKIFDIILKFLYVGEIDDIYGISTIDNKEPTQWKLANILKAIDMYQIEDMKAILGYIASKFINIDNVAYCFSIAVDYNTYNLKCSCVSFIKNYGSQICNNKTFQDTIIANPTVALNLIYCLLDK